MQIPAAVESAGVSEGRVSMTVSKSLPVSRTLLWILLHTDSWSSSQSETQVEVDHVIWSKVSGRYKIIYADTCSIWVCWNQWEPSQNEWQVCSCLQDSSQYSVTYWLLIEPSIRDASGRRSRDLIESKWALLNNICRYLRQLSLLESVRAESEPPCRHWEGPAGDRGPYQASVCATPTEKQKKCSVGSWR